MFKKLLFNRRTTIICLLLLLIGSYFIFNNAIYFKFFPWQPIDYGNSSSRVSFGDDNNFYVRSASERELYKINQAGEILDYILLENVNLGSRIELFDINSNGLIYAVITQSDPLKPEKLISQINIYDQQGHLLRNIEQIEQQRFAKLASPISGFQLSQDNLYYLLLSENSISVKKFIDGQLTILQSISADEGFISNIEDCDFRQNDGAILLAMKNGQFFSIDAAGQRQLEQESINNEIAWNISATNQSAFYYADLFSNAIVKLDTLSSSKQAVINLTELQPLIDMNLCDEILRNYTVSNNDLICLNTRTAFWLLNDDSKQSYPATGHWSSHMQQTLYLFWFAVFFSCLVFLLLFLQLLRWAVKYPTELIKVMFYLFLIAAAGLIASYITQENIMEEYENTLINSNQQITAIASRVFDVEDLQKINGKSDYDSPAYQRLHEQSSQIFLNQSNDEVMIDRSFTLLKYDNGILHTVITNSWHGLWYPFPDNETTQEMYDIIRQSKATYSLNHYGEKTYLISYAPLLTDEDKPAGMIMVTQDLSDIYAGLKNKFWRDMVGILFLLVTFHLIIVELNQVLSAWKKSLQHQQPLRGSPALIRTISFLTYMPVSMSLLYCATRIGQFDLSSVALPQQVIMATPFAVEMLSIVALNLLLAHRLDKYGWRPQMLLGISLMIIGCLLTWQADELLTFLLGRVFCGAAFATQVNSLKTFIVCGTDIELRKRGQADRATGRFAGGLCGITIGTLLASYSNIQITFLASAIIAVLLLITTLSLTKNRRAPATVNAAAINTWQAIWIMLKQPRMLGFLLLAFFPLYFLDSFNSYIVPIVAKASGLSNDYIGYASFIVYLCCAYFSKPLALALTARFSIYRCIIGGWLLYVLAAALLQLMPNLGGVLLSSLVFGLGISINGGLITELFLRSFITPKIGVSNMNNICAILFAVKGGLGPLLLGFFWQYAAGNGILLYCGLAVAMLIIYLLKFRRDLAAPN